MEVVGRLETTRVHTCKNIHAKVAAVTQNENGIFLKAG